jgi:hypothetical protein
MSLETSSRDRLFSMSSGTSCILVLHQTLRFFQLLIAHASALEADVRFLVVHIHLVPGMLLIRVWAGGGKSIHRPEPVQLQSEAPGEGRREGHLLLNDLFLFVSELYGICERF